MSLAERLNSSRPSTSRALHRLRERGLVTRDGRRWSLTSEGRAEAQHAISGVSLGLIRAVEKHASFQRSIASDLVRVGAGPSLELLKSARRMTEIADGPALQMMRDVQMSTSLKGLAVSASAFRGLGFDAASTKLLMPASVLAGLDRAAAASIVEFGARLPKVTPPGFRAFAAAAELQRVQADAFMSVTAAPEWREIIGMNQAVTGRVMADLAALPNVSTGLLSERLHGTLLGVTERLVSASASQAVSILMEGPAWGQMPRAMAVDLMAPSHATASFVSGARHLMQPPPSRPSRVQPRSDFADVGDRLRAVDPESAEAWEAAWDALSELGPGWARSAAHQGRECVRILLERLAPDDLISRDREEKVTRRMRILYALRGDRPQLAEWADAQAEAGVRTLGILNREAHAPQLDPVALGDVLASLGGLVIVLTRVGRGP